MLHTKRLEYYKRELNYLLTQGKEFADKYPHIADALGINTDDYSDPDLKKLIQSFALLSSKLNYKIDEQFDHISSQLLELLYPHFAHTIPPFSILHYESSKMHQLNNTLIPADSVLSHKDVNVKTCFDLTLSDSKITHVSIESGADYNLAATYVLNLTITNTKPSMNFYINLDYEHSFTLFRLLFEQNAKIYIKTDSGIKLTNAFIKPANIELSNSLYKLNDYSNTQLELVQSFMMFYQHFMFIQIKGLEACEQVQILITLSNNANTSYIQLDSNSLLSNCVSCINLFDHFTVPIAIDHTVSKYLVESINHNWAVHSLIDGKTYGQTVVNYSSYMNNDDQQQNHYVTERFEEQIYVSLQHSTDSLSDTTLILNAKHFNSNISNIKPNSSFIPKQTIASLKCSNLIKFTTAVSNVETNALSIIKLLHTHMLDAFHNFDQNYLKQLLMLFNNVNKCHVDIERFITKINVKKGAKYHKIGQIWCPLPMLNVDIFINSAYNDQSFVFGYIVGQTFKRLAPMNLCVEFNILDNL